jgi:hypothetical protein
MPSPMPIFTPLDSPFVSDGTVEELVGVDVVGWFRGKRICRLESLYAFIRECAEYRHLKSDQTLLEK